MAKVHQSETIAFLERPESFGEGVSSVETIETHISMIFLAGDRVYKLKRAVKLPYVDFLPVARRLDACRKEVELNGRTAPAIYLGVREITRGDDGVLAFDGEGETVDAVVEMQRFDQECLFDRMAGKGALTPPLMAELADEIAGFHRRANVVHEGGGSANISAVLEINEAGFAASDVFESDALDALNNAFRSALRTHAPLLDHREEEGAVRRCHGDLHLRNICLFDGRPQLFDCIEFNEQIATVDVLYDLAFLLMDLEHRDLRGHANRVANRYLDVTGDDDGFVLLPFFMAIRAAVRAHVTATQAMESQRDKKELVAEARSYFDLARKLLQSADKRIVAIGGLSGSGKSTIAEALAPNLGCAPGARIVESDRVRKALFGVAPETRLGAEAYTPEISKKVYSEMAARAGAIAGAGGTVIADAVFDRPADRDTIEEAARAASAPFTGVWLDTPPETLRSRVESRAKGASDATVDILERQLERDTGTMKWHRISSEGDAADIAESVSELPAR